MTINVADRRRVDRVECAEGAQRPKPEASGCRLWHKPVIVVVDGRGTLPLAIYYSMTG